MFMFISNFFALCFKTWETGALSRWVLLPNSLVIKCLIRGNKQTYNCSRVLSIKNGGFRYHLTLWSHPGEELRWARFCALQIIIDVACFHTVVS